MIMVLLNISYIPDEVVQKINFKPGWSIEFKKNMESYKRHFYEQTGVKWEYQNSRLEADYIDFIHTQEELDTDAIKEKTADSIDSKLKDFYMNIKNHRKNQLNTGSGGPVDMKALGAFSANIGKNNTI